MLWGVDELQERAITRNAIDILGAVCRRGYYSQSRGHLGPSDLVGDVPHCPALPRRVDKLQQRAIAPDAINILSAVAWIGGHSESRGHLCAPDLPGDIPHCPALPRRVDKLQQRAIAPDAINI